MPSAKGFWLKVVADFPQSDFESLVDILDTHLEQRQSQWHELLIEGRRLSANDRHELFWFAYRSPWPLSGRDCLYAKYRIPMKDEDQIALAYWTVEDDALMPKDARYVRIDFQACHLLKRGRDGNPAQYAYIQTSDAKVPLPNFLLKGPQVDILIKEVEGLRSAVKQPIIK